MFLDLSWLCLFVAAAFPPAPEPPVLSGCSVFAAGSAGGIIASREGPSGPSGKEGRQGKTGAGPEEDEKFLDEAVREAYRGSYRRGERDLEDYLAGHPASPRALEALAGLELRVGRPARALETARRLRKAAPGDERGLLLLARALCSLGRYEEAEKELEAAPGSGRGGSERSLAVTAALAEVLFETGRRREARDLARKRLAELDSKRPGGMENLAAARLCFLLGDLEKASVFAVLADAAVNGKRGPHYRRERFEPLLFLGDLYRITRLDSGNRALEAYGDALKINPNLPGALLGRARTRLYGMKTGPAEADCDRALLLNPNHPGALAFKARLLIRKGRYGEAMGLIEKGLGINPREKRLLARKAACLHLEGNLKGAREALAAALAVDPSSGAAEGAVGEALLDHYRFSEARDFLKRSLERDPDFKEGYILLGRALANLGLEKEAREALEESLRRDPFPYPWRYNMLKILGELELKKRVRLGHAVYLFDPDEWKVLRHDLPARLEASWAVFEKKYGIVPPAPVTVEMFPRREDFAVRTVGFTGLGALGACFGRVVTLLSPRAGGFRRRFNWAATLHHEMAHVFTLALSRHRVPRWLSEGFSVFEEQAARKTWARDMEKDLVDAYWNEELIPLKSFNEAFFGPRVLFAYYQAGLFVSFLEETFGWDALVGILKGYGRDLGTEEAFSSVLGEGAFGPGGRRLDAAFRSWVERTVISRVHVRPSWSEKKREEFIDALGRSGRDPELLSRAAWACFDRGKEVDARYYLDRLLGIDPGNASGLSLSGAIALDAGRTDRAETFFRRSLKAGEEEFHVLVSLGILALGKGRPDEAVDFFERAIAAAPGFVGPGNPYELAVDCDLSRGEEEKGYARLAAFVGIVETDFGDRLRLARRSRAAGRIEEAVRFLREAVEIDPFVRRVRLELGRDLESLKRPAEALDELDAALAIRPGHELRKVRAGAGIRPGHAFREDRAGAAGGEDGGLAAEIHAARAAALIGLGRIEEAKKEIETALSLDPDNEEAEKLSRKIGGGLPRRGPP